MRNIKGIFKKEIDKVFKFPRTIFTTLLLPGFIIFIVYFAIGQAVGSSLKKVQEHESIIYLIEAPQSFYDAAEVARNIPEFGKFTFQEKNLNDLDALKDEIKEGKADAVVVFDADFDNKISGNQKPQVRIYYDESFNNSSVALNRIQTILEIQKDDYLRDMEIDPNIFAYVGESVYEEDRSGGTFLAMILPILILSFIFSSAMGIGTDAIAGEKERGTLAKLLLLPIARNDIIIGKILSTTVLTILSALSSFLGIIASLPFLKTLFAMDGGTMEISYSAGDVLLLLGILVLLAALASTLLLLASTIARTVKEASAFATPLFIAVMVLPMMTMFSDKSSVSRGVYLIPIYNFIIVLKDLLSFNLDIVNYLLTAGSSLVVITALVLVLVKLFKSEKILYTQ
ncbi:MAG: ABC transporter permease [Bacilli bacterium]|mgnify:CR=1 FL=1|jgi:sodium transport system permease protein